MTSDERLDAPPEDHLGFQLSASETPLYLEPDMSSRVPTNLAEGTVVTVLERTGGFLRIVTEDDRFGYILDSTPMTPVEDRMVEGWTVQAPEIDPVSIPMTARVPAPWDSREHAPPDVSGLEGSRRRNALVFLSRLNEKAEGDQAPDGRALLRGIAAATVGMVGLLL